MPLASFQPRTDLLAVRWQMGIEPFERKTQKTIFRPTFHNPPRDLQSSKIPILAQTSRAARHAMGLIFKNVDFEIDLRYVGTSPLVSWNLGLMNPMFEADGRSLMDRHTGG